MKIFAARYIFRSRKSYSTVQLIQESPKSNENSTKDEKYEYIQKSKLPTYHFQQSLPRLPIPSLEKTCERYLKAQKPLLNGEAWTKTEQIVKKFKEKGHKFHEELKAIDNKNKHTSYISEPWFDMYLRDRVPLPINYNPLLVFVNDPKLEYNNQLIRATNMLISSVRFLNSLRSEVLAPEVFHLNPKKSDTELFRNVTRFLPPSLSWYGAYLFKAFPLDMSQYTSLFNSSRIPEIGKDRLFRNEEAKHVLVMKKGNFYTFDVKNEDGNMLSPTEFLSCMKYILDDPMPAPEFPIGVLTASNRDKWATARKHLEEIGNKEVLNKIDSSLFNIMLDDWKLEENRNLMIENFLYGNETNRWFDKSFSLLVAQDGLSALNFEHSWGDGVAVLRYFQDILKDTIEHPFVHPDSQPANCQPETLVSKLGFKLDDKARNFICEAIKEYNIAKQLDLNLLEVPGFGKKDCKQHKVSPDSIMQLAFQVAYHQYSGKYTATYESCSTAAFRHGRTETIRPCTEATTAFCEAISSANRPSQAHLRAMIENCSLVHGNLTKEAAMGQGFDRHLFGLRLVAQQRGGPLPDIFEDPAYAGMNYNILSTSTLSSSAVQAGGFGPVVKDGFGIGYSILDDRLGAVVTSYPSHQNGAQFVECLQNAFKKIVHILKQSRL